MFAKRQTRITFLSVTAVASYSMGSIGMNPGKASREQLTARLERRRSNAAGYHLNKGLRDKADWRKDLDDEITPDERYEV